jgi:hypothetical protein
VGAEPYGIAISRTGATAYVANFGSNTVSVVGLLHHDSSEQIAVDEKPFALAIDCRGAACSEPPYTLAPTATLPPTPTPTVTGERSPTPTRTPTARLLTTASPVATPSPAPVAHVRIGSASGAPGERVRFDVSLESSEPVVAVQNDIAFEPHAPIAARTSGSPDCRGNAATGKTALFSFQPSGCRSTMNCTGVRAIVISLENTDPIPSGSVLYSCFVAIASDARPSTYRLTISNITAAAVAGALPSAGSDGAIVVHGRSAQAASPAPAARRCSGGGNDGLPCAGDIECPAGVCVIAQGICDGGDDDGLWCDCPGGTCVPEPACAAKPGRGTCSEGPAAGTCCDLASNCRGRRPCVGTAMLCAGGPGKGQPCLRDEQCPDAACRPLARYCAGGDFARYACVDHGDCPRGRCVDPYATPTPVATPRAGAATPTPLLPGSSRLDTATTGGGCRIDRSSSVDSTGLLGLLLPAVLIRRRARQRMPLRRTWL